MELFCCTVPAARLVQQQPCSLAVAPLRVWPQHLQHGSLSSPARAELGQPATVCLVEYNETFFKEQKPPLTWPSVCYRKCRRTGSPLLTALDPQAHAAEPLRAAPLQRRHNSVGCNSFDSTELVVQEVMVIFSIDIYWGEQ